jgi:hypothetical protein
MEMNGYGMRSEKELGVLSAETYVPKWAHVLMDTYFANWPCDDTQMFYKSLGAVGSQYVYWELRKIFCSRLMYDDQFKALPHVAEHVIGKYPRDCGYVRVRDMDDADRHSVFAAFTTQLGMHTGTIEYSIRDFPSPDYDPMFGQAEAPTPAAQAAATSLAACTTSGGGGGSVTHDV